MKMSLQEALDLLHKWHGERRLVQAGLFYSPDSNCMTIARIERIDAEILRIDGSSRDPLGHRYGFCLSIKDAQSV